MDWIHCNGCFVQPRASSSSPKFYLTSCGHIFCERCNQSASSNKCRVCEAEYTTTELSSQLREEVRDFFVDPATLLNKVTKIIQFQNGHRERLQSYLRRAQVKYETAKRDIQKLHEEEKSNRKKIHALQQEIAWYKMQRDRMRSRIPATPASLPATSPLANFALSPSNSQCGGLSSMRSSGLGNSRITMGFTGNSLRRPSHDVSPLSVLGNNTPFGGHQYRSQNFATPESGVSSIRPNFDTSISSSTRSDYRHSSQDIRRMARPTPPSRDTPTDALKILSLAYKNNNN